jgi:hypothetical protein
MAGDGQLCDRPVGSNHRDETPDRVHPATLRESLGLGFPRHADNPSPRKTPTGGSGATAIVAHPWQPPAIGQTRLILPIRFENRGKATMTGLPLGVRESLNHLKFTRMSRKSDIF